MSNESLIRKSLEHELYHLLKIGAIDCIKINIEQIVRRLMTRIEPSEIPLLSEVQLATSISAILADMPHRQLDRIMELFKPYIAKQKPVSLGQCVKALHPYIETGQPTAVAKAVLDAAGVNYAD